MIGSMTLAELSRHARSLGIVSLTSSRDAVRGWTVRAVIQLVSCQTWDDMISSDAAGMGSTTLDEAVELVLARVSKRREEERAP